MKKSYRRVSRVGLLASLALGGVSAAAQQPVVSAPAVQAKAGNSGPSRNEADVHFMSGMIPHHAQAVLIAAWAGSHGARDDVRILCERIVVGQRDEIGLMQFWLREHGAPVPDAKSTHMKMKMDGMEHDMLMPGMLNDEQLAQLDKARSADFDRLFLNAMIGHHEGAIIMVDELFGTAGDQCNIHRETILSPAETEMQRMKRSSQSQMQPPPGCTKKCGLALCDNSESAASP